MILRFPPCTLRSLGSSTSRTPIQFSFSSRTSTSLPSTTKTPQTPLFLRPLVHTNTLYNLQSFHHWAKSLALSSSHPDPSHLIQELKWLLQDSTTLPPQFLHLGTSETTHGTVSMRVELDELYLLWKQRVEDRRPLQYIVGCEHWRDLVLVVREGVLIPRPETEMVVDLVKEVEGFESGWWADLGTGSGAIAVGIARYLGEKGRVFATDLSDMAVEVAGINVERYGLKDKVDIRHGSWFEPLQDVNGKLAGLVSNPPYIPSRDMPGLQAEVGRYEPRLALDGGEDGMDHLLKLFEGCCSALKQGGFFAFETNGDEHSELIMELTSTKWRDCLRDVKIVKDLAGIKRFVTGFRR